jgi:5-methyltetrahydrofolate--homocysteine methyltransferase
LHSNGYLSFEGAYDLFQEQILVCHEADVDLIVVEAMRDLLEAKAAILAAQENAIHLFLLS